MAGLISTGIAGFLSSAKFTGKQIANKAGKLVPEIVSTFVSGLSGWIIKNNGDAEFKSIYARDKFITNEYVYNRIRVTEDEEIISSSMKILSAINNGNGTWTIYPDLREGDVNPLTAGDLMMGYYHDPANSGVVYAVQKMTVKADPDLSQGVIVTLEEGSVPYPHMIIVRVGNTTNVDRQSFIRISSRTNCQYFYDEINSWTAYGDPDKVKCTIGKADIGLIPAWAASAVGSVKRWFGLIADGVILRGIFILKSSGKTIEKELEGVGDVITKVETRFEIREGQISSKVEETKTYAESAADSARDAAGSAEASEASKVISVEKSAEAKQTADGFQNTVTEVTKKAVADAVAGADTVIEEKVSTQVTQSAKEWKVEVMGADADGNPNSVLAAINADESGVQIKGNKVQITGELLAEIIKASGLIIQGSWQDTLMDVFSLTFKYGVEKNIQPSLKIRSVVSSQHYPFVEMTGNTLSGEERSDRSGPNGGSTVSHWRISADGFKFTKNGQIGSWNMGWGFILDIDHGLTEFYPSSDPKDGSYSVNITRWSPGHLPNYDKAISGNIYATEDGMLKIKDYVPRF